MSLIGSRPVNAVAVTIPKQSTKNSAKKSSRKERKKDQKIDRSEEVYVPESVPELQEVTIKPKRVLADIGNGRFNEYLHFSVPKKSQEPYEDIVSFSIGSWKTTGEGRNDAKNAALSLLSSGNNATVSMSNLLDFEEYSVVVRYSQTYFFDEERTRTYTDENGKQHTEVYKVKVSRTVRGSLSGSVTTPEDTYIRNRFDLKEKVHKYSSLTVVNDIDCGECQSDIDGKGRARWLDKGNIFSVSINGNGNTIRRQFDGFIFHIWDGATLTLKQAKLDAFSGSLIKTPTYGNEFVTSTPTGQALGSGIEVGSDSSFDERETSSGNLILADSSVMAHNCGIVLRSGTADVKGSLIYGMADKDLFIDGIGKQLMGVGILAENSGNTTARLNTSGSSVFGRCNGILMAGNTSGEVRSCNVRSDCGDAFDFRSSGNLDISKCSISGIKGIDVFDDVTYAAVYEALKGTDFNRTQFNKIMPESKGTVSVSYTHIGLVTGAFRENASANSYAIQNRGKLTLGKGITIKTSHSKAWGSLPQEHRAEACGIYNVTSLELPDDIYIEADDRAIIENRDIGIIRNAVRLNGGSDAYAASIEKAITGRYDLSDILDYGNGSEIVITGGIIRAANIAVDIIFGSAAVDVQKSVDIDGRLCSISLGKNGTDNILGTDFSVADLQIDGSGLVQLTTSLQGRGIDIKESGKAILSGKDIYISDYTGPCGIGIRNAGKLLALNAKISAQNSGIVNLENGTGYLGDDLDTSGNCIKISGAVYGIKNNGILYYYRDVMIDNSIRAGVWQNGIFYMLPGSVVEKSDAGNAIFLTSKKSEGEEIKNTVRILYEPQYEKDLHKINALLNTASDDRNSGRVMVKLYSADGINDISADSYTRITPKEKLRITGMLSGFSLSYEKVKSHPAALRCGLGYYRTDEKRAPEVQPLDGEKTNGRTGTLILSCLLAGSYDADFPVRKKSISSKVPEKTKFYWREPTEFTVAPLSIEEDRCRIFFKDKDITPGLLQLGYRDKEGKSYGRKIYDSKRVIRIFEDDHVFCAVWDTDFTMIFDGNGQTNEAKNYKKDHIHAGYTFEGNTGPDGDTPDYFVKSIKRSRYDQESLKDEDYLHQTSFQGWSFDKHAAYMDDGVFCKDDVLHGETAGSDSMKVLYDNYDAISFYIKAFEKNVAEVRDDNCEVRVFAVWDEYPVITAYDSSFYSDELDEEDEILRRLLKEDKVTASDFEDGALDQDDIEVFTDPVSKTFSLEKLKGMGDIGSIMIYYSVKDKKNADITRFRQNTSVTRAKVYVMSEDAEDTRDDIDGSSEMTNSGSSNDTYYSTPIYVRAIDGDNLRDGSTFEKNSVWREPGYEKVLTQALEKTEEKTGSLEKWIFKGDDIKKSKELTYGKKADTLTWRNCFLSNRVSEQMDARSDKNKPLIVEEGLSSLRFTWDIKAETDRVDITLSQWADAKIVSFDREHGKKMASSATFNDLKPGEKYLITADFYYRDKKVCTLKETAQTRVLAKPSLTVFRKDNGKKTNIRLSFEKDERAEKYLIERSRIKGDDTYDWTVIKEIDQFTENDNGDRYLDSDVIRFDTVIEEEGVYRYRVISKGRRIGMKDMSEKSDYSDEYETAFLLKPEVEETLSGCRSIKLILKERSCADFIRVNYRDDAGVLRHSDLKPDKDNSVIISKGMKDLSVYAITAGAHIKSPASGIDYTSLISDEIREETLFLNAPELISKKHTDIYTGKGIRLIFKSDENAVGYEVKEDVLYPADVKGEYQTAQIMEFAEKADGANLAEYVKNGGDSRVSEYRVRTVFRTLDGKTFYKYSSKARAAYIRMQAASQNLIDRGDSVFENFTTDPNASCYLVITEEGDEKEEIYVHPGFKKACIYSPERTRQITQLKTVLIYDGREYRAL